MDALCNDVRPHPFAVSVLFTQPFLSLILSLALTVGTRSLLSHTVVPTAPTFGFASPVVSPLPRAAAAFTCQSLTSRATIAGADRVRISNPSCAIPAHGFYPVFVSRHSDLT